MDYCIIDIETTGSSARNHRITEIAISRFDGHRQIDYFETLINPEQSIPGFISSLTGITDEMVKNAPFFYEVAGRIIKIMENTIFVAHNVSFDYHFVRQEFLRLGYNFNKSKLCTVRLARKVFSGLPSYSLGNLCHFLQIPHYDKHRAGGDTRATLILFQKIIEAGGGSEIAHSLKRNSGEQILPPFLSSENFIKIPDLCGIYYFLDDKGKIIYIGKSVHIRKRILQHFSVWSKSKKGLFQEVYDLDYVACGSILIASLMESAEIKKHWPKYNRAQKLSYKNYGIIRYTDQKGFYRLGILQRADPHLELIRSFARLQDARNFLHRFSVKYDICPVICGLQSAKESCLQYMTGACQGQCRELTMMALANDRLDQALAGIEEDKMSFIITDNGRQSDEVSFVIMEKGIYLGYGFLSDEDKIASLSEFKDRIIWQKDNRDVQYIIHSFLQAHPHKVRYIKPDDT